MIKIYIYHYHCYYHYCNDINILFWLIFIPKLWFDTLFIISLILLLVFLHLIIVAFYHTMLGWCCLYNLYSINTSSSSLAWYPSYFVIYIYIYIYIQIYMHICIQWTYINMHIHTQIYMSLIGIILRWGFLIWELIFYLLRTFCPHLGSFFCVVSSFTTFRPNFHLWPSSGDLPHNRIPSNYCLP